MKDDLKYWVWLSSVPGIGASTFYALHRKFRDLRKLWEAEHLNYERIKWIDDRAARNILSKEYKDKTDDYFIMMKKYNIDVLTVRDGNYPLNLRNIFDPPPVLYSRGSILREDEKAVAIVGSRDATPYGIRMAETLARGLAANGITVVSGMARGIDTAAHRGALSAGGRTIAVLGCGVDTVYPKENSELMEKIISGGAVISEYPPGTPPKPVNFPARNRIISGLSKGVAVIEAGEKSGSLITVDFALEQGRDVFAVPGNVDSSHSTGTNRLIKDGAKPVTSVEDILEELNCGIPPESIKKDDTGNKKNIANIEKEYGKLEDGERAVLNIILDQPKHLEYIVYETGYDAGIVGSILTILELRGIIRQLPGMMFTLEDK